MNRVVSESSGGYPWLSFSDFADYIKVDYGTTGSDNAQVENCAMAAAQYLEKVGHMNVSVKNVRMIANDFGPYSVNYEGRLGASPVVKYYDDNNALQTLANPSVWLENNGDGTSTLYVVPASTPQLYQRADAVEITFSVEPYSPIVGDDMKMIAYQLGAYFYDCRVNEREPQMTIVEKMVFALRTNVI